MKDINTISLSGRLTRDAELKYTQGGFAICTFSIACNSTQKDGDGYKDYANFFDCVIFGKLGEAVNSKLVKGIQVFLAGELGQDRWTDNEGKAKSKVKIKINDIRIVTGKNESAQVAQPEDVPSNVNDFTGEIPF